MEVRTQALSQPRRLNARAWLAFLFGLLSAAVIPVAIELTRKIPGAELLDAVWAIPVAAAAATLSLLFARGARGAIARTLQPVGGEGCIRLGRIFALAVLVFAAWQIPGSSTHVPGLGKKQQRHSASAGQLVLHGVGRGTYVEVRRSRASGKVDLQGTVEAGQTDRLPGSRFYLLVRTPAGLRVTLDGHAVALPAVHNLRVLVTPNRTTRLRG